MGNHGGARKGSGRKKGIGITYDIQKHCDKFIRELMKDEVVRKKAVKQLELEYKENKNCVYVLEADGYFKIGFTSNFNKRIKNYKTHNPNVKTLLIKECLNAFDIEVYLHEKYKANQVTGEWYNFNKIELIDLFNIITEK